MNNIINNQESNQFIGSFNSFSGEPSQSLKDKLLVPFKRFQTKSLISQYKSGIKLFDLHVRYNAKFKKFCPSSGSWSTGKALLQIMSELNKEVQSNNDKVYYILTLDNEITDVDIDSISTIDEAISESAWSGIITKFNTLSESLNTFYKSLDLVAKQITPKQPLYNKIFNKRFTVSIWKDKDNSDIEWTEYVHNYFIPIVTYNIKKYSSVIYNKCIDTYYKLINKICGEVSDKAEQDNKTDTEPDNVYLLKEFV